MRWHVCLLHACFHKAESDYITGPVHIVYTLVLFQALSKIEREDLERMKLAETRLAQACCTCSD